MTDIVIIGAGMAGLSAALELKRRGVSYIVLEAAEEPGGRAQTRILPSGVHADLGGHWLHGENTPLKNLLKDYHIPWHKDKAGSLRVYEDGEVKKYSGEKWLDKSIDHGKAKSIERGTVPDCPVTELAKDPEGESKLRHFATMWNGIDPPLAPSAREFLTDQSTPGGLELEGGMRALLDQMVDDAGRENIRLHTAAASISSGKDNVCIQTRDGETIKAGKAIFTGSLGVLNSGVVAFDPPLSEKLHAYLSGLVMGQMNKIIFEVEPEFFKQRGIPQDMGVILLEQEPPHFCHIHSAGAPLITLFISGNDAEQVERLSGDEALAYALRYLSPVREIAGFEHHLVSPPLVTHWVGNPYIRGAYSSCLPGARRSGPWVEAHVCFCGDTFDDEYPASMAGAYLSGKKAAQIIV
jgi:monoamine oxidase